MNNIYDMSSLSLPLNGPIIERLFLKSFYKHDLQEFIHSSGLEKFENKLVIEELFRLLTKYKTEDIISIILENYQIQHIEKADIPQFSNFQDAYDKVPYLLLNCGITGVGYSKMGFMLRSESRKDGADKKYGENHLKTAALLGLCEIKHYLAYPTLLASVFIEQSDIVKKSVIPKLCLYIPFIQNYYAQGANQRVLDEGLNVLKESTKIRRRPNCRTIISIIDKAIENEL